MAISLRLDEESERRLNALAKTTGRSKTFYLKKLIAEHLDDLEDAYLAEHALEELRQGKDRLIDADAFWDETDLGEKLDD